MSLTDERIREMFDAWFDPDDNGNYWGCFLDAYRIAEAEAAKPQEPTSIPSGEDYAETHKMAVTKDWLAGWNNCKELVEAFPVETKPQEPFCWAVRGTILKNENWMLFFEGEHHIAKGFLDARYDGKPAYEGFALYTTPQLCPKCAEGMVSVTKEDANNYCRILTLLGMEEEGSPVEGVERLISLRDGMTCGDCNDTGWLENREEGRYPCTCMTEAEPYQILQAKCASLDHQVSEGHKNTLRLESVIRDFEVQTKELEAERDALQKTVDEYRESFPRVQSQRNAFERRMDELEHERDALTSALAAKTADFDRLCKDFDEHDAELKRIIAGLRAELAQAKIYMPARSAEPMPKTENGPCDFEYWRLVEVAEGTTK